MNEGRVAVRYARALVEVLTERKALEQASIFKAFCGVVAENGELRGFFANVTIGAPDKEKVVLALSEKLGLPDILKRFLAVLAANGRLDILAEVATAMDRYVDEQQNIQTVELTTAAALSEQELSVFKVSMNKMLGSDIRITSLVDPSIFGGAIAKVGSSVYDGSVRGQLNRLRKELVKEI